MYDLTKTLPGNYSITLMTIIPGKHINKISRSLFNHFDNYQVVTVDTLVQFPKIIVAIHSYMQWY